jgi:predicted exporter
MRWAVLGLSILAGTVLVLHAGPYWEDALASMSPIPAADLAVDARLRSEIGAPDVRNLLVIEGRDREAVLQASEAMAAALAPVVASGGITGFETPSRFLPSQAAQAMRRDAIPAKAVLAANLAEAVAATPFRFESFAPFLVDAEAARTGPLLERGDLDGTSLALQVDTLLLSRKSGWAALLPLQGVADPGALARQIAGLGRPDVVFVDLRRESDGLLSSYRAEAVKLSLAGSAVIVLLLAVSLRRPRRIVAVLLPLVAAVLCTAALLLGFGHRLSIFNLFGLLLVVAVGSNYALFFEETDPAAAPAGRVVASLMLANLCTVIGFGILGFSDIPVLGGIGGTVAIGALLSLVFAAVLSPQPQPQPQPQRRPA